jgi:hypothetical protein
MAGKQTAGIFLDLLNLQYQNCGLSPHLVRCVPEVKGDDRSAPLGLSIAGSDCLLHRQGSVGTIETEYEAI